MYLEFGQFDVDFCLPHAADANTGVAAEFIPFRSTDKSPERDAALVATIKMLREGGMQLSGGSSGLPDRSVKLRPACAVARETLKAAAAARQGVPIRKLTTADGVVILPAGRKIPCVELPAQAWKD